MQTAKLQSSQCIRAVSPEPLLFCLDYIKVSCLRKQTAELLARLRGCAGSLEALLFAYARKPIFLRRGLLSKWPVYVLSNVELHDVICIIKRAIYLNVISIKRTQIIQENMLLNYQNFSFHDFDCFFMQ